MINTQKIRLITAKWPYGLMSVMAAIASFGTYSCMYAYRKAFSAGTFSGLQYLHVDYKVWLVIAQLIGYTLSKFVGIRFIAEVDGRNRARYILGLIGMAWAALLGFAIVPAPYNIVFMLLNGFPLGVIWGLVFGYLEGRKATEFMAAVLCVSLIFASGFVKFVGRTLLLSFRVSEYWMPFTVGLIFALPLLLFVFLLEILPPPTPEDIQLRVPRVKMNAADRKKFVLTFLPGIILTVGIYLLLTVVRDIRDNFEVEIWSGFGINTPATYAEIDTFISIVVLVLISLLILIRNNLKAFVVIHWMIIGGCLLIGVATVALNMQVISPFTWMACAGLGLYMGYIPYNAIFFERMIATFRYKSNVGFLIYVADSIGYLGSVSVLFYKQFGTSHISWCSFFQAAVLFIAIGGGIASTCSLLYFVNKAKAHPEKTQQPDLALA